MADFSFNLFHIFTVLSAFSLFMSGRSFGKDCWIHYQH